jgi:hypothetical protein
MGPRKKDASIIEGVGRVFGHAFLSFQEKIKEFRLISSD